MKRFLLVTMAVAVCMGLSLSVPATATVAALPDPPFKYAKGRNNPDPLVLAGRHAAALRRLDRRLKSLPTASAVSYDCRTLGIVPPVKDQSSCGSCWNFSGTGTVESACIKAGYGKADSFNLSEQYTMDCGRNGGCNGDDNVTVLEWAKATGLPLTKDYGPYTASSGRCKSGSYQMYKIHEWGYCDKNQGQGVAPTQDIKDAMVAYGPIGSAVAAGGSAFWNSGNGTDTGRSNSIDHDIILVGWDDAHDNGDGSKGAWIMRNSWGTGWGQDGYAWVKYGADSIGTEAVWCSATALPPPVPPDPPVPPVPPVPPQPGSKVASSVVITYSDGSTQTLPDPHSVLVTRETTLAEILAAVEKLKALPPKEPPLAPLIPAELNDVRWKEQEGVNKALLLGFKQIADELKDIKKQLAPPVKP